MSASEHIRIVVAKEFADVGEFRTADATLLFEDDKEFEIDLNLVSAALTGWEKQNRIVRGRRIRSRKQGKSTRVWKLYSANGAEDARAEVSNEAPWAAGQVLTSDNIPVAKPRGKELVFYLKADKGNGQMLVEDADGQLYKVEVFRDW